MEWLSQNAWTVWLGLTVALGAAEMLSLDFVLIMLAVGAGGGLVVALAGGPVVLQVVVAAITAVGMIALVRPPVLRRLKAGPELTLGHSKLVGSRGTVTVTATGLVPGRVRLGGEEWSAAPYDEHLTIAAGETVEVFEIRGATAYVHPVPTLEA
jgi:membrane protein implicated in regulation of membrane protease activity